MFTTPTPTPTIFSPLPHLLHNNISSDPPPPPLLLPQQQQQQSHNDSLFDVDRYLQELDEKEALDQLPVMMVLSLMSFVGFSGNAVVFFVYYTRFPPSSTRTFIIAMSLFDLLSCSVSLPGEVLDLRFPYTYTARWACRLHRWISVCLILVSAMTLVAVALDRRRKVCYSFKRQLTSRQVSYSVAGCVATSVLIGFPFVLINGHHTIHTDLEGVVGSACSVDDDYIHTSFPLVYNAILLLIFITFVGVMSASYVHIARKIFHHKRKTLARQGGPVTGTAFQVLKQNDTESQQTSSRFEDRSCDLDQGVYKSKAATITSSSSSRKTSELAEDSKVDDGFASQTTDPEGILEAKAGSEAAEGHLPCDPNLVVACSEEVEVVVVEESGKMSRSVKEREQGLELAVKTLEHAVSEEILRSSELFNTQKPSPPFPRPRSAEFAETGTGPAKPLLTTTSFHIQAQHDVENSSDVKPKPGRTKEGGDVTGKERAKATSSRARQQCGKKIPSRTTWMMFVLTAIFIISFLPYLTIVIVRATNRHIETGLHGWKLNLYTLGLKSYFINCIVNPFVYSFCSAVFRHHCRHLFQSRPRICCNR